jgi:DNA-binding transcriptional LysR family regulator
VRCLKHWGNKDGAAIGAAVNIASFREFIVLARCLNFTEAASILHVTQPALSKHVSALEAEFGTTLLVRNRRTVQLSDAGRVLLGALTDIVDIYDHARSEIDSLTKNAPLLIDGILFDSTIESIISLAQVLLSESKAPPVIYSHKEDGNFMEMLLCDDVAAIFSYDTDERLEELGLAYEPLSRSRFVAILDRDHPLAKCESVRIEQLKGETFVKFIDEYNVPGWMQVEELCRAHGFIPKTRGVLGRGAMSYAATSPDGGVLVLQQNLKHIKFLTEAKQLPCLPIVDEDAEFRIYFIYKKENAERLAGLLAALRESRDTVLKHSKHQM